MMASALRQRLRGGGAWQRLLRGVFWLSPGRRRRSSVTSRRCCTPDPAASSPDPRVVRLRGVPTPASSVIDVLIPAARQRRNADFVRIHPTVRMPEEVVTVGPVRLAPLARAVADTARGLARLSDVRALVAAVVQQGNASPVSLPSNCEAGPVQGSALFRIAVSDVCDGVWSSPEADLKDLIRRSKIGEPLFNPSLYAGDEFIGQARCMVEGGRCRCRGGLARLSPLARRSRAHPETRCPDGRTRHHRAALHPAPDPHRARDGCCRDPVGPGRGQFSLQAPHPYHRGDTRT